VFFSDIFPSERTMALGSTQPLVKMSTRNIPGGKGGRCVGLTTSLPSRAECHEIWESKPPGMEEFYIKIWNASYTNSEKASHTKPLVPSILHRMTLTLWPNHIFTHFLTNHGCFRSYLYKRKKAPKPLCSCPEKAEQTARHLMTDCSLFSKERPAVSRKLPLSQIMQYHINTAEVSRLIKNIYHMLQEQSKSDQTL